MASNRIGRINEEIQREMANLLRAVKDPRLQSGLVTITHVDTTSDLRYAKIYISALDKSQEKDMMKGLKSASGYLRRELGSALRLRYTPELQFVADDSIQQGRTFWRCCGTPPWSSPQIQPMNILFWRMSNEQSFA